MSICKYLGFYLGVHSELVKATPHARQSEMGELFTGALTEAEVFANPDT